MGMQGFSVAADAAGVAGCGDWQVQADGLEHARTGYFIARHEIAKRRSDGLWMWPVHMMEKDWVAEDAFAAAFRLALAAFGIAADAMLDRSFREHEAGFDEPADDVPVPRGRVPKTKTGAGSERRRRDAAAAGAKPGKTAKPTTAPKRSDAAKTRMVGK